MATEPKEEEAATAASQAKWTIGYALSSRKQKNIVTPTLLSLARQRSIALIPIDPTIELDLHPPFHAILHKLPDPTWHSTLLSFISRNPSVPVVDDPLAVARLHHRDSMLDAASRLSLPRRDESLGVPRQIVVEDRAKVELCGSDLVGFFPIVAKPMRADGQAGTHDLVLVLRNEGLLNLKFPVVLQEFVNHGGVLFKVYVIGNYVKCVKRKSLPDVTAERLGGGDAFLPFSQVSNAPSQDGQIDDQLKSAGMPSLGFIEDVARGLRQATGLQLFNFDLIRDAKVENHYLVIDINYFPGYEKIDSFEEIFVEFLLSIVCENANCVYHEISPSSAIPQIVGCI